jgi:condensin complex subunit 1
MARYFLSELQKKDPRSILNSIPDLMSNLPNNHEQIVPQIISYIDKNSVEHLVERLITTLAETDGSYCT